ncbi:phosphoglycolate phosphatase-like HAD superfamily hydrolase [Marinimicrobium koreense]|uniref:phosphoglycolate phosphatase n=1 Tax=Marinimicrobium koreense TaxID=306545 RepID=A0A3N1NXN3_9GAMM|nr:HAD family hydrolase [Marinimicrobium koreense]ROQ20058.1 phosphoglycolate phosphatase-like HAD superfamily hydrolase [Marinimicrobium koreense]
MMDQYRTIVFDCDGVILDSNKVKTEAFYQAALPYGEEAARALVQYHVSNGGISRYVKFEAFLSELAPAGTPGPGLDELLERYASSVKQGLLECRVTEGLDELRAATPKASWLVASGGDQNELRSVFAQRELASLFDGGIFGSPDDKKVILQRELAALPDDKPALFIGDSRYDHEVAQTFGLDFVFVSQWTEFSGWEAYCRSHGIPVVDAPRDLLS